jgi:cell division protein FtsQ
VKPSRFILLSVLLSAAIWGGWRYMDQRDAANRPIRYVKVEGAFQYIHPDRLKDVMTPELKRGFYHADMAALHAAISGLPLVQQVDIKRVWPDAVYVKIVEHKPIVRWGADSLLNNQGELLKPDHIEEFQRLPLLTGPEGQEKKLLEVMKNVYEVLRDKSLHLAEFHVNQRRAWQVKLSSGLEMQLGAKDPMQNMQRFLKTMDLLGEDQIALMASVDTRYPNGYAVTWKTDLTDGIDWQAIAAHNKT